MMNSKSAINAVRKTEPETCNYLVGLSQSGTNDISTATLVEAQIVQTCQLGNPDGSAHELMFSRPEIQPIRQDIRSLLTGEDFSHTSMKVAP